MAAAKIHADNTKRWMNVNESQIKGVVNHLIYNYIIVDPSGPQIYSRSVHYVTTSVDVFRKKPRPTESLACSAVVGSHAALIPMLGLHWAKVILETSHSHRVEIDTLNLGEPSQAPQLVCHAACAAGIICEAKA